MAMKGRYWNFEENRPEPELEKTLNEKVEDVKSRIKKSTGVEVEPIYYCAGYKEEGMPQSNPYNLSKLLYYIITHIPTKKRLAIVPNINNNPVVWQDDDELMDYSECVENSLMESIEKYATKGADIGESIGSVFGGIGGKMGRVIGGVIGGGLGFMKKFGECLSRRGRRRW